jgi:hypothetical protein
MSVRNLDKLLTPRSLALIGATPRPGSVGAVVARNMRRADLGDLSLLRSDATVPTWWTQYPDGYPVLTGWLAGPKADRVSSLAEAELIDMGLASLGEIFDLPLIAIPKR